MSDQSKKINEEGHSMGEPGKRLEKKTGGPPSPQQAKKKRERWIMIVMLLLAAVMSAAAAAVVLHSRWVKKPSLPPAPTPPARV